MEQKNKFLAEEKITKLLIKFSVPCILSLLVSSLYNIVDQIFIGNSSLGFLGNAATTVVFPITVVTMAFSWCFGDGTAAYLSICQGRKDTAAAHKCVGGSITVTFFISIVFVVLSAVFTEPLLYLFGASEASIGYATEYFIIILIGTPFSMIMNAMNSIIRADGSPKFAMFSTLLGAAINIILDPILIFGCNMGIAGAAIATIVGQIASFIVSVAYFFKSKTFRLKLKSFLPDPKLLIKCFKLGISTLITQFSIVVISLVCNIVLSRYGKMTEYGADIPIAAIGIVMKVFTIVINISIGIIIGGQPILGYNYGAGNLKRVKETFLKILLATFVVGVAATLVFQLCPKLIISIFGTQSELYNSFAVSTLRIFLALILCTGFIKVASIFFQAVGQPVKAAVISLSRDIVCFVPLVLLLPLKMGIYGALWAAPIADGIGMVLTAALLISFFRKLKAQQNKEPNVTELPAEEPFSETIKQ